MILSEKHGRFRQNQPNHEILKQNRADGEDNGVAASTYRLSERCYCKHCPARRVDGEAAAQQRPPREAVAAAQPTLTPAPASARRGPTAR